MNGTVQNLKEAWQKMPGKTKKMIAVIAAGTIILAAAGLLVLNIGTKKGYSTLFTGSLLAFEVYASYIKSVARSFYSQLLLLWIPMRTKFPPVLSFCLFLMLFLIPFI